MSLIVAAYNAENIVIGAESLSTLTQSDRPFTPERDEVRKVTEINTNLALMITGKYMSDKIVFISSYTQAARNTTDLDEAFRVLFDRASRNMTIHRDEGFAIGLAGYASNGPSFRLIIRSYGDDIGYVQDYPYNHYFSGPENVVQRAESLLMASGIPSQPSTDEIENKIREIIEVCIREYPATLGGPVTTTILSRP
jgi:hypothetical protein